MGLSNIPTWWSIALALGILLMLMYWDVQSRPKRLRWARFVALIIVVSSLFVLYVGPYQISPSQREKVAWVTENAESVVSDSLVNKGFILAENSQDYQEIASSKGIEQLVVAGDGLEQWELEQVQEITDFIPSTLLEEGVMDYALGNAVEQSSLEIAFQLNLNQSITLTLSGSGIETVEKEISDQSKIILEVMPTVLGYLTYQLDGIRAGDTLFSETIPVHVKEKQPTNVLMISNTPSFEFRGLKNYLAESGFGVAERLKVSSDLYHQAFTNMGQKRLTNLSNRLLDNFQLIVIDAVAYQDLTRREQQRIQSKLERGELGLVLMGGKGATNLVSWNSRKSEKIIFRGENGDVKLSSSKWQLNGLVKNLEYGNNSIAQIKVYGLGKIGRPLFTDSYLLKLQAEKQLYAQVWQNLLEDVIGKTEEQSLFQISDFPRMDEPSELQVISSDLIDLQVEGIRLAPEQQWFSPTTWTTTYWPENRGWQKVTKDGVETARFFAFDSTDWILQSRMKKQAQTATYLGLKSTRETNIQSIKTPISKWIFFGLFLVGMTFLWVEQRVQ